MKTSSGTSSTLLRDVALVVLLACALLVCARRALRSSAPPNSINGSYQVTFAGAYTGTGKAAVGAKSVTINGKVTDPAGNRVNLIAPALKLDGYRFIGAGSVGGQTLAISGRIDPADATLGTPRITATFTVNGANPARAVGFHQ